jgi:acetylornithine deacetylase/succinyl-diaminopimelate desuccinylase-like protein
MLPDRGADAFIEDVAERVEGTGVKVTKIMAFSPAISDWDTPLLDTIQAQILKRHPDAQFASAVSTGFTDSHFTRDLGIQSYGFSPMLYLDGETKGVHGNNEAVHIGRYRQAVDDYVEIVEAFTQL